ncbi:hypothetical protein TW65_06887 [Stemphylium lycopersici]|uniref:Uncharacterized protein n=1 Tax=Stemphylium lycopersici TaxID=183478 RepID=A0A364MV76_STELY|nr:hypothetical protein TW65_06887 [Stemphylium lycopersici]RAR03778.1 hypothetical protein DDE83_008077 [Stemphylium lycopersici]
MRALIVISTLAACIAAIPRPQAVSDPTTPAATLITLSAILPISTTLTSDSTSLNIPITAVPDPDPDNGNEDDSDDDDESSTSKKGNPHREPIPIFTKKCQCQLATARYPCWATDALQCSSLYKPTPRPGPHPCEMAPYPPRMTSSWSVVTSFPTLTGFPNATFSLPVVPTANATFTTVVASSSGGV